MLNRLDQALGFHQESLRLRGLRQEVLAGNIANADTPGYKAKDFDFAAAMDAAIRTGAVTSASQPAALSMANPDSGFSPDTSLPGSIAALIRERRAEQGTVDQNTVSVDQERNAFLENALRYEASLTLVNSQIRGLQAAIQG